MMVLPTPAAFQSDVTNASVEVLPLVTQTKQQWSPGWCTYPDGFENNPDIEIFCGGINEKTARAAGCWRQGNLLHFGFEQSPAEMNEAGRRLLLNSIAYISRFTEDRPIAVTPSVFAGPVALPRTYLDRRIQTTGSVSELTWILASGLIKELEPLSAAQRRVWYAEHRPYLHPGAEFKLDLDLDALQLRAPLDRPEFFSNTIAALRTPGESAGRARRLLAHYGPTEVDRAQTAEAWSKWFSSNEPYLFFSDQGDYRWYVDPLARKRGIPSRDLRGPKRATAQVLDQ